MRRGCNSRKRSLTPAAFMNTVLLRSQIIQMDKTFANSAISRKSVDMILAKFSETHFFFLINDQI